MMCIFTQNSQLRISGSNMVGGSKIESLSLTLPIFHGSFLMTPGLFPLKTKQYLHRHPVDSKLLYWAKET